MPRTNWKLSPSDFAFLWDECKRCFYLKVARQMPRPRPPMPKIFLRIDAAMKAYFTGKATAEVTSVLPPGTIDCKERWVRSARISRAGRSSTCFINGRSDAVVRFDDGSHGVIDFKTSEIREEHAGLYGRQLHAYAYALEHPAQGRPALSRVTRLGLLCVEPSDMARTPEGLYCYRGEAAWIECPRNEAAFLEFIGEVLAVLERPEPPPAAEGCQWCDYRDVARRTGL